MFARCLELGDVLVTTGRNVEGRSLKINNEDIYTEGPQATDGSCILANAECGCAESYICIDSICGCQHQNVRQGVIVDICCSNWTSSDFHCCRTDSLWNNQEIKTKAIV